MSEVDSVERLVASISPLLAGHHPMIQGAALADLVATWLAGYFIRADQGETDALRERLLTVHVEQVRALTVINAAEIHGDTRR